jgi:hypothetical protein
VTDWTAVASSRINAVRYDASTGTLGVIFSGGEVWNYAGVSEHQHRELMDSPSIGKTFEAIRRDHQGSREY